MGYGKILSTLSLCQSILVKVCQLVGKILSGRRPKILSVCQPEFSGKSLSVYWEKFVSLIDENSASLSLTDCKSLDFGEFPTGFFGPGFENGLFKTACS